MDTTDNVQFYITIVRTLKFDKDGPGIPMVANPDHFFQVVDLNSTQEANFRFITLTLS